MCELLNKNWRQLQSQLLEPESERQGLLEQEPRVLVLAAAIKAAQHQEHIDDVGIGAGPADLQFDLLQFALAQLQLQFRQVRRLAIQKLRIGQAQQLFLLGVEIEILVNAFDDGGLKESDLMNFVEKIVQGAGERSQEH